MRDRNGNNEVSKWPPPLASIDDDSEGENEEDYEYYESDPRVLARASTTVEPSILHHRFNMYHTVMDRIAKRFYWILNASSLSAMPVEYNAPRNRNILFKHSPALGYKGMHLNPIYRNEPIITVQISDLSDTDSPFRIKLSLQGITEYDQDSKSMIYDASFSKD